MGLKGTQNHTVKTVRWSSYIKYVYLFCQQYFPAQILHLASNNHPDILRFEASALCRIEQNTFRYFDNF